MSISDLAKKLEALSKVPDQIAGDVASGIKTAVLRSFEQGTDPYGRAWVGLKSGKPARLNASGKLRGTLDSKATHTTVVISLDFPYIFHAAGTENMPARPVLTIGVMPATWHEIINKSFQDAIKNNYK